MTTAELARLLLPDQATRRFASHELVEPVFPGGPLTAIRFFARPTPIEGDLCRREVVYVNLEPTVQLDAKRVRQDVPMKFASISPSVQITAAPQCLLEAGGFFAWVQPVRALGGAQEALRRLLSLQKAAQSGATLPVEVTCKSETPENACNRPPRALLATLPLHQTFIIDRHQMGWEFSVMPNGPGQVFWEVTLPAERAAEQEISLVWRGPAPL